MNPWNILGINPTGDVSAIKKAYAQKLKIYHPEEDPQGYQKLREAYDLVLKQAKWVKDREKDSEIKLSVNPEITPDEDQHAKQEDSSCESDSRENIHEPPRIVFPGQYLQKPVSQEEQNSEFMSQVEALYNDFFSRIQIDNWKLLLNSDVMWKINNRKILGIRILDFLTAHHYLPQEIWKLLDSNFSWCDKENAIDLNSFKAIILYIEKQIKLSKPLRFSFFRPIEGVDYEKFLELRENAYKAFSENDLAAAKSYMEQAREVYGNDPDLLRLEGRYLMSERCFDEAISIFDKLLGINPEDTDALYYRAAAYYEKNDVRKSIEDYNLVISKIPENTEIPLLLAKCHHRAGDLEKSRQWLIKAIELKPSENETKTLLSQVQAKLRISYKEELRKDSSNKDLKLKLKALKAEIAQKNGARKNTDGIIKRNKGLLKLYMVIGIILAVLFIFNQIINTSKHGGTSDTLKATGIEAVSSESTIGTQIPGEDLPVELNGNNIETLAPSNQKVTVTLQDMKSLDWLVTGSKDPAGMDEYSFKSIAPGSSLSLEQNFFGRAFIGKLNNKSVIVAAGALYMLQFIQSPSKPVTFDAYIYGNPDKPLMSSVKRDIDLGKLAKSYSSLVTDRYLVTVNSVDLDLSGITAGEHVNNSTGSPIYSLSFIFIIIAFLGSYFRKIKVKQH